jgi:hypothetical protein
VKLKSDERTQICFCTRSWRNTLILLHFRIINCVAGGAIQDGGILTVFSVVCSVNLFVNYTVIAAQSSPIEIIKFYFVLQSDSKDCWVLVDEADQHRDKIREHCFIEGPQYSNTL